VRPPLGGVRQRESDGGQVVVGGVPVDAVAPCVGLDGDGGAGGDPGPGGLTAGLPAHPVPARLHAGRIRAAWGPALVFGGRRLRLDAGSAVTTAESSALYVYRLTVAPRILQRGAVTHPDKLATSPTYTCSEMVAVIFADDQDLNQGRSERLICGCRAVRVDRLRMLPV
jgi:hypothetical protein